MGGEWWQCRLRDPGFAWDGSSYPQGRRGLAVCRDSLILHSEPLEFILTSAPSGFPSHSKLQYMFQHLQGLYRIFGEVMPGDHGRISSESADR